MQRGWNRAAGTRIVLMAIGMMIGQGGLGQGGFAHGQVIISDRAIGDAAEAVDAPNPILADGEPGEVAPFPDATTASRDDVSLIVEDEAATPVPDTAAAPDRLEPMTVHGRSCSCSRCCKVECHDSRGLFQHCREASQARWTARVDALLLWRNSPRERPIFSAWDQEAGSTGDTAMDADDLDSTMGAGPRISLFRTDCHGHTAEFTYFQAFNFLAEQATVPSDAGYTIRPDGIFGNEWADLDTGTAQLTSGIKSFEVNGRRCLTRNISLLGGFRWVEWREAVAVRDMFRPADLSRIDRDLYDTSTMNSLYGGQIGFDARMFDRGWLRIDAVMKGGAYYNVAVQQSSYRVALSGEPADLIGRTYDEGGRAAFVGELGFMGTIPLTDHFEFTFGYLGLWLESLAQPTNQFGSQRIVPDEPVRGTLDTTGGTVLQGVTLGFNAKW